MTALQRTVSNILDILQTNLKIQNELLVVFKDLKQRVQAIEKENANDREKD